MFQDQACKAGDNLRMFEEAGVPIVSIYIAIQVHIYIYIYILIYIY
jgi:hypothetical protein